MNEKTKAEPPLNYSRRNFLHTTVTTGAGMALMIIIAGLLGGIIPLLGYALRVVRDVESILPDCDTLPSGIVP